MARGAGCDSVEDDLLGPDTGLDDTATQQVNSTQPMRPTQESLTQTTTTEATKKNRIWKRSEEAEMVVAMRKCKNIGWLSNGSFKTGGLTYIETHLQATIPGCGLRKNPHITNRIRLWKEQHKAILTLQSRSGSVWCDVDKSFNKCPDEIWSKLAKDFPKILTFKDRRWPLFDDWCELFGRDIATGKRSKAFGEGCSKILAADRLFRANSAELEEGYDLSGAAVEEGAVDKPENCKVGSHIPDIAEGIVVPKKRKMKSIGETDAAFLNMMDGFINMSKEVILGITKPKVSEASSAVLESDDDEFVMIATELAKFNNIGPTYRVHIDLKLVADKGLRTYFLSLSDEDKFEFVGSQVQIIQRADEQN